MAGRINQVRIIGGRWRGRRLHFPAVTGLRPTPDRVRETLFNWLNPHLSGGHCLDLFAGSGALGLEALSRGAATATLVERDGAVVRQLQDNITRLGADSATVVQADGLRWLQQTPMTTMDIVLLDPPFHRNLLLPTCTALMSKGWLADSAWIYLEAEAAWSVDTLPTGWHLHRQQSLGQGQVLLCHYLSTAKG